MEKYSFLLPAYKSRFFEEALQSIKGQTLKEFKCIVSDDCSPEDIKPIFDKVVGKDPRFIYRRNKTNIGSKSLVDHWNLLVDMCDTDFFIMASDDDIYDQYYLEKIDCLAQQYKDINLFRPHIKLIDEKGITDREEPFLGAFLDWVHFFRMVYLTESVYCEGAYCYRTNVFKRNGKYVDTPLAWYTDNATHILMAKNGCALAKEVLYSFRTSNLSISGTITDKVAALKVKASFIYWRWINDIVVKMPDDKFRLKEIALVDCRKDIIVNINNYLIRCCAYDFIHYLRHAQKEFGLSRFVFVYNWLGYKLFVLRRKLFKNI